MSTTEARMLEIGDVLYNARPGERPTKKIVINRVTDYQATDGKVRVKRSAEYGNYRQIGEYEHYYFGDEQSEAKYQQYLIDAKQRKRQQSLASELQFRTNFSRLSLEQLEAITNIISPTTQTS